MTALIRPNSARGTSLVRSTNLRQIRPTLSRCCPHSAGLRPPQGDFGRRGPGFDHSCTGFGRCVSPLRPTWARFQPESARIPPSWEDAGCFVLDLSRVSKRLSKTRKSEITFRGPTSQRAIAQPPLWTFLACPTPHVDLLGILYRNRPKHILLIITPGCELVGGGRGQPRDTRVCTKDRPFGRKAVGDGKSSVLDGCCGGGLVVLGVGQAT